MRKFRNSALIAILATAGIGIASADPNGHAVATAPGQNKLQCFDGTADGPPWGGTCVLNSHGAKGSATLTVTTLGTDYAGVYTPTSTMYGQLLSDVKTLSFNYTGDAPGAGAPRFSVPIDTDGDGDTDQYAFISAYYCNDGAGQVDAINDPTCTIWLGGVVPYANWAALAAAYPAGRIATDAYVFVIADEPGTWTVNQVRFGKPGK